MRTIVHVILLIGGLNWGLIGIFDFNLVDTIFGVGSILSRIVYAVVGLCALYEVVTFQSWVKRSMHGTGGRMDRAA